MLKAPPPIVAENPLVSETAPPVFCVLSPLERVMRPPEPVLPELINMLTLPLVPDRAEPARTTMDPLLPLEEVPDLKLRLELVPTIPASGVCSENAPLLVDVPLPEPRETEPPVASDALPA